MASKEALLIGNSSYRDPKFSKLMTPVDDVRDLGEVLRDPGIGGFDKVRILLDCDLDEAQEQIGRLFHDKTRDDLVLLYFSGHGFVDVARDLFFALPRTAVERPYGTALPSSFVKEVMNKSRSRRQVLILDCCHSGAFEGGTKDAIGTHVLTEKTFDVGGYGRVILTSSTATQLSWDGARIIGDTKRSLFTHFIVDGLKSGAAGRGGAGITIEEMYNYAHDRVIQEQSAQTPQRWVDGLVGNLVIARNPQGSAGEDATGRMAIRDAMESAEPAPRWLDRSADLAIDVSGKTGRQPGRQSSADTPRGIEADTFTSIQDIHNSMFERMPPAGGVQAAGAAKASAIEPKGIGGWLVVALVWLVAVCGLSIFALAIGTRESLDEWARASDNLPVTATATISAYAVFSASLVLLWQFLKRSSRTPHFYVAWLFVPPLQLLAITVAADLWNYYLEYLLPGMAAAVVGTLYFLRSRRVKNTFIR